MRKLIAVMNMTLDGFCDHTAMNADKETHRHYTNLLLGADTIIYGTTTYQLMEDFWPAIVAKPIGEAELDDFANAIDDVQKLVFSHTLQEVNWKNARIATKSIEEEVADLKKGTGKDLYVGSPGMIVACTNLGVVDELQICIHPVIAGKGLTLFRDITERIELSLSRTKTFECGAVLCYYKVNKGRELA